VTRPKRALLLVDHGSRRPEAHEHLEGIAARLRARRPDLAVYVAHMELVPPTVADAVAACARDGVEELLVHPFFLVPGLHAVADVPRLVNDALAAHPGLSARITAPLGSVAGIADLILATVPED
jgi:sirohydrochlorin ferrochelatase